MWWITFQLIIQQNEESEMANQCSSVYFGYCATNAKTILAESSNAATPSPFEFTYTLGKLLLLPHMQCRYQDSSNFSTIVVHKMHQVLSIPIDKP